MKSRIFLIGGYNKAIFLANSLIKKGYSVTAINKDSERCVSLASIDKLTVFNGDGSMPYVLEEANVYNADIVIALTNRDDDNLVICELCKKRFRVKKTVALITDPKKTDFFYRMGIDSVVCAVTTIASVIEQHIVINDFSRMISLDDSGIKVSLLPIADGAPAVNKKIRDLGLPKQAIIGCVQRGDKNMIPHGDTRIHAGDVLVLITLDELESMTTRELTGR